MNYAIVKTGGKQYRVEQGQWLLVERLRADEGSEVKLEPLLVRDGDKLADEPAAAGHGDDVAVDLRHRVVGLVHVRLDDEDVHLLAVA